MKRLRVVLCGVALALLPSTSALQMPYIPIPDTQNRYHFWSRTSTIYHERFPYFVFNSSLGAW